MKRRDVLTSALGLTAGAMSSNWFSPWVRAAAAADPGAVAKDRYFIFCYFGGGWDVLLSLDPRDPVEFGASTVEQTRIYAGYELLQNGPMTPIIETACGPMGYFTGDLFTQHSDKIAVVRGINMETLSHDGGQKRFTTGKAPSGTQARGSAAATWLASKLGAADIIPNLVSQAMTFNADQPAYASGIKVANVRDLLRAVRPTDPQLTPAVAAQLHAVLQETSQCPEALKSTFQQNAALSRGKATEMVAGGIDSAFDFLANKPEMLAVRDHYGFGNNLNTGAARAAMAARAIMNGVSRCVSVNVTGGLDTHDDSWTRNQGPRQMSGFNAIARMVEDLESNEYGNTGLSWMDHTTIVAYSEFSRTPRVNMRTGRDHWLVSSSMIMGPDIQGGQVIGRSSDVGMEAVQCDLATGQPSTDGVILKPEHILQTLFKTVNITDDPADLRVDPIAALLK